MQDHLDRDALERLVHRRCHASRAYGWLLHLLACIECRERVVRTYPGRGERFLREIFRTQEPLKPPDLEDQDRLDRVLENLQTYGLAEYLQEGDIPPLLADLHRHPPERQRLILDNTERLWNLGTVEYLIHSCEVEFHRHADHGRHLAELAISVLERLSPSHYHPKLLMDLQGRAWSRRGNLLRILGNYHAARLDFDRAAVFLKHGSGDEAEQARILQFRSTLESMVGRLETSVCLARKSLRLYHRLGDQAGELHSVITIAKVLSYSGHTQESIRLAECTLEELDIGRVDGLTMVALLGNLSTHLGIVGHGPLAYRHYHEARRWQPPGLPRLKARMDLAKVAVLEALGDFSAADQFAQSLQEEGSAYLSYRDLAALYTDRARLALRRGDRQLARRHAQEACSLFDSHGWPQLANTTRLMMAGGPLAQLY